LGLVKHIHERVIEARAQQDNELWHLLIREELLAGSRQAQPRLKFFWLPQLIAFAYYQQSWLRYVIHPRWSYRLNADLEGHVEHEYMLFVITIPNGRTSLSAPVLPTSTGPLNLWRTCSAKSATTSACTRRKAWRR